MNCPKHHSVAPPDFFVDSVEFARGFAVPADPPAGLLSLRQRSGGDDGDRNRAGHGSNYRPRDRSKPGSHVTCMGLFLSSGCYWFLFTFFAEGPWVRIPFPSVNRLSYKPVNPRAVGGKARLSPIDVRRAGSGAHSTGALTGCWRLAGRSPW